MSAAGSLPVRFGRPTVIVVFQERKHKVFVIYSRRDRQIRCLQMYRAYAACLVQAGNIKETAKLPAKALGKASARATGKPVVKPSAAAVPVGCSRFCIAWSGSHSVHCLILPLHNQLRSI